jgi:hypothetical protein
VRVFVFCPGWQPRVGFALADQSWVHSPSSFNKIWVEAS